jgi:high-affinity iron transporter
MLQTAIIVFREFLEIALVLTIVLAATRGLTSRAWLVGAGLAIGVAGSVLIAFFTDAIAEAIDGVGQEVFNACIMFIAVGFLSWTVIWMKQHGRVMAQNLKQVGSDVISGKRPLYVITAVVALATFREGAEIVMFTYGMSLSGQHTIGSIVAGGVLGAVGGTVVGVMLYFGLLKAAKRNLFTVTSWMLILLTAGMAAQGAGFLIAADILPALAPQVWDTSNIISGHSLLGEMLGVLIGYTPRPTGMELLFYCAVIVSVGTMYYVVGSRKPTFQRA